MTWNTKSFEEVLEKWSRDEVGPEPRAIEHPDYPDISFYVWISYAREYYHDAVAILRSFQPL